MAETGLKVLAVARGTENIKTLPKTQDEINYKFLGLIGFVDPVRPTVASAISLCYKAGIKVTMVTGDYPETAKYVSREIGLNNFENVVTGQEISEMSEIDLRKIVATTSIFARIMPEEKLRIVNALKANGEVVAMTGDGVNDAPALKSANIGIALGKRSTDVAKEASSLILLEEDFSSLVETIKLGRRIYNNLKRAIMYILAIHVPIAGVALISPLFHLPLILFPLHIVFLELIIDPSSSIAFETTEGDKDLMLKPPRKLNQPFLNTNVLFFSLVQGTIILLGCITLILLTRYLNLAENTSRTITFITLVISNIGLMFVNLNGSENMWNSITRSTDTVKLIVLGTVILLIATLYIPSLRSLFLFSGLKFNEVFISLLSAFLIISCIELFELIVRKMGNKNGDLLNIW